MQVNALNSQRLLWVWVRILGMELVYRRTHLHSKKGISRFLYSLSFVFPFFLSYFSFSLLFNRLGGREGGREKEENHSPHLVRLVLHSKNRHLLY
jgi:hypothetical protein